jgi:transposase-like protein
MNLIEFTERYPDELSCQTAFKELREKEGITCKKCGSKSHYWKSDKKAFECKKCKSRTSLRSGTVMEHSRLPFRYWLLAIHLMTSTKKSISALEMQRQLGHKFYEPIWEMMHKIRRMMGKRDTNYVLDDTVELDEGFFSHVREVQEETNKDEPPKRGRGSQNKAKVLVMTSTEPVDTYNKHEKPSKLKFIKMLVIRDLSANMIESQVKACIHSEATVKTDGFKSYSKLKTMVAQHQSFVVPPKEACSVLPWVHTMISNAKRTFAGIHHMMLEGYMQNYLDEFCYKVNRRYFGNKLFDRLLIACVADVWYD